jgi:hypothetical protein
MGGAPESQSSEEALALGLAARGENKAKVKKAARLIFLRSTLSVMLDVSAMSGVCFPEEKIGWWRG